MLHFSLWKRIVIIGLCIFGLVMALPNGFYTRVETHNDAVVAIELKGSTPQREADRALWPDWMPSSLVNLGLDLRGGAHLLAEVNVTEVYDSRIKAMWTIVRDTLKAERATVGSIRRQPSADGVLKVKISKPEGMARALELVRGLATPVQSISGVGSSDIEVSGQGDIITIVMSEAEKLATDERTMAQSLEIIRRRVDEVGTREPTIQRQGANRILIQVPGLGSAQELKDLLGKPAKLEFKPVVGQTSDPKANPGPRNELLPDVDNGEQPSPSDSFYILEEIPVVTGLELVNSQPSFDQNGSPAVSFRFNADGARKFGIYTAENIGSPFAIVLDNEVISAPTIQSAISGGSGIITGNFTIEESTKLAVLLRAGALPASMEFLEERTIGPELGQDSIDAGKIAAIVAGVAVLIFMILSYGMFGLIADVALVVNVGLIFGLLSMIGATLTLPGIAGIVLTIGMAVDANVLIFERIREELKGGKGPARAIELGYEKALSAILDANITTFITAVILFVMGSGPVRGFAVTLAFGIITSVFTAIYVTRLIITMWLERRRPKKIEV